MSRTVCRMLMVAAILAGLAVAGCGSSSSEDDVATELVRQNEIAQAREEAAADAEQAARLERLEADLAREKRRSRRNRTEPTTPRVIPIPAAPDAAPEVPTARVIAFHTGADADKALPATFCRIEANVYCWTPNDGYTLSMSTGAPVRLRGDEAGNRGRAPDGYDYLAFGQTRAANGFRCTSQPTGLSCVSDSGHGWTLPRYVGLPSLY